MHTQRERNLTTVMHIVFDDMPDDPLACERILLPLVRSLEDMLQVGKRPVCK